MEEGREGWLAAAYIIGADGWRERGILGKDDGREEDGRWGFYMCGRRERKGGRDRGLCTSVMQRRD